MPQQTTKTDQPLEILRRELIAITHSEARILSGASGVPFTNLWDIRTGAQPAPDPAQMRALSVAIHLRAREKEDNAGDNI